MERRTRHDPVEILMVEDNPGDVRLVTELLGELRTDLRFHVVRDGVEAMMFLNRTGNYSEAVRPDLILLDLNVPRKSGREVLREIRDDESLHTIPIIVLTSSEADDDINQAYTLCANCYVTKPVDLDRFTQTIRAIENFWLSTARLPSRDG